MAAGESNTIAQQQQPITRYTVATQRPATMSSLKRHLQPPPATTYVEVMSSTPPPPPTKVSATIDLVGDSEDRDPAVLFAKHQDHLNDLLQVDYSNAIEHQWSKQNTKKNPVLPMTLLGNNLAWIIENHLLQESCLPSSSTPVGVPVRAFAEILATHLLVPPNKRGLVTHLLVNRILVESELEPDPLLSCVIHPLAHLYLITHFHHRAIRRLSQTSWQKLVVDDFEEVYDGFQTYIPLEPMKNFVEWCKALPKAHLANEIPQQLQSSFTLKTSKGPTVMDTYSTPANSPNARAVASGSMKRSTVYDHQAVNEATTEEEGEDSSDELGDEYFTARPSTKTTGPTGCNISVNHLDKCYTWKSERFPMWKKHVDIKVYDNLKEMKKAQDSLALWKCATFKAKLTIGNPTTLPQTRRLTRALKELQEAILENAKLFPGVKEVAQDLRPTK